MTFQLLQLSFQLWLPPPDIFEIHIDAHIGSDILLLVISGDFSSVEAQKTYCFCSPPVSLAN